MAAWFDAYAAWCSLLDRNDGDAKLADGPALVIRCPVGCGTVNYEVPAATDGGNSSWPGNSTAAADA
jgi:hypothetical protein